MARVKARRNQEQGGVAVANGTRYQADQGVSKTDAIGEAIKELGKHASSRDLIGFAQQKFGVEVSPSYVSMIKTKLKKRGKRGGGKRRPVEVEELQNGQPLRGTPAARGLDPAKLVLQVKELAQRTGGLAALKRLVDALVV